MFSRGSLTLTVFLIVFSMISANALADGNETLGPPGLTVATGTGVVVAGVGTQPNVNTSATIDVDVPLDATVEQVLVYWQGQVSSGPGPDTPDDEISINGTPVEGVWTASPVNPYLGENFYTFRYDATALELVEPGENTLTVSGMNFETTSISPTGNKGVGVAVIYDDSSGGTVAGVLDGMDYAYSGFSTPLNTTEEQTFEFAPSSEERTASLGLMVGEALDHDFTGVQGLVVEGEFDTSETFSLVNELQSNQGFELDAAEHEVTIPAGAESVTVRLVSQGGDQPASFLWFFASLEIDAPAAPSVTANLWVNTTAGGSPQRCATPCAYDVDEAYGTFAAAVAAASCGDVIRVKTGTYPKQGGFGKSCSGSSRVTIIGEDDTVVDSGSVSGSEVSCDDPLPNTCAYLTLNLDGNITLQNVDVTGDYPIFQMHGANNTWRDSAITGREIRKCNSDEPVLLQDGSAAEGFPTITNSAFINIDVGEFKGSLAGDGGCPVNDNFHLEQFRIGRGVSGVLIDRSTFRACLGGTGYVGCGSGHIFLTHSSGSGSNIPQDVVITNSKFFGAQGAVHTSGTTPQDVDWTLAYNTMLVEPIIDNTLYLTGVKLIGNVGPRPQYCFTGWTFTRNLWQAASGPGTGCGTDTVVSGTSWGVTPADLDLDSALDPESGSPVLDAGETGGYCTGALGSVDFYGNARPFGSACDAGAVERQS
jgi:hypothetical protein